MQSLTMHPQHVPFFPRMPVAGHLAMVRVRVSLCMRVHAAVHALRHVRVQIACIGQRTCM